MFAGSGFFAPHNSRGFGYRVQKWTGELLYVTISQETDFEFRPLLWIFLHVIVWHVFHYYNTIAGFHTVWDDRFIDQAQEEVRGASKQILYT